MTVQYCATSKDAESIAAKQLLWLCIYPKMASEVISEYYFSWGTMPPHPPSVAHLCTHTYTPCGNPGYMGLWTITKITRSKACRYYNLWLVKKIGQGYYWHQPLGSTNTTKRLLSPTNQDRSGRQRCSLHPKTEQKMGRKNFIPSPSHKP